MKVRKTESKGDKPKHKKSKSGKSKFNKPKGKVMLLVGGILFCILLTGWELVQNRSIKSYSVARAEDGAVPQEVTLDYQLEDGEKGKVKIVLPEITYSKEETLSMLKQAEEQIDELILGDNTSLQEVRNNLNLVTEIPDSPVSISWNSDQMDYIDYEGKLGSEIPEEGAQVQLEAELMLQDETDTLSRLVTVYPPKGETGTNKRLEAITRQENQELTGKKYVLPKTYEGQQVIWKESPEYTGPKLLLLTVVFAAAYWVMEKKQQQDREEKRREALMQDYPEIISKLQLLLSAGLSIRKCFERISVDYEKLRRMRNLPKRESYEMITVICHEMQSGVEEVRAYEHLGKYCNCPAYKSLSTILTQNLRRGSRGIVELMEHESRSAFEDRKRQAKVKGDKAGTRLLFPMVLMLGVVMVIIMIPAYLSFAV